MTVEVERADGVVTVRLARPQKRNALTMELTNALTAAFESAADDGAVALLAAGDHFCVGGDVADMAGADDAEQYVVGLADAFHRAILAMRAAPPVVVGVRGWAAGAGMSTVLAGDVVVAGENASFQPAYPGIGATPDGGMTWTLPRLIGAHRARALMLENRAVTAADALSLGFVDHVVPDAEVDAKAVAIATTLAAGPRAALAGIKRLVDDGTGRALEPHLDAEARSIGACIGSPDGQEGVQAFLERRKPRFGGR